MIQLTERDQNILKFLREYGWALSTQVNNRYFPTPHLGSNRMRKLEREGLVESLTLNAFKRRFWHERPLMRVFSGTNPKTKVYRLSGKLREPLSHRWKQVGDDSMLAHQVLCGYVQEQIKNQIPEGVFVSEGSESFYKSLDVSYKDQSNWLPDTVLLWKGHRVAIEIERKARRGKGKFNFAYQERFNTQSSEYSAVIYYVENEIDLKFLIETADLIKNIGFVSLLSPNEVLRSGRPPLSFKEFLIQTLES